MEVRTAKKLGQHAHEVCVVLEQLERGLVSGSVSWEAAVAGLQQCAGELAKLRAEASQQLQHVVALPRCSSSSSPHDASSAAALLRTRLVPELEQPQQLVPNLSQQQLEDALQRTHRVLNALKTRLDAMLARPQRPANNNTTSATTADTPAAHPSLQKLHAAVTNGNFV